MMVEDSEWEIISREPVRGATARSIVGLTGRHHSAISREISRMGGRDLYRAVEAQGRCEEQRARPKELRTGPSPDSGRAISWRARSPSP
jgi:IS30 family transposase